MKKIFIIVLVLMIFLCSCNLKSNNIAIKNTSNQEMTVSKPETDYSNLHELAKMYEKLVLGRTIRTYSPVLFTINILAEFNKDEDYMNDHAFIMPYEKTKEIASLFFCKELIAIYDDSIYYSYPDDDNYKDIILEPFEINDNGEEVSVLYGRFIDDVDGNRRWLYPVIYTVVPYILTEDEIPLILSDELKAGEQRYRIKNIENITNLEHAKKIYSNNGYGDLVVDKTYEISSPDDVLEMAKRVNSEIYNEMNATYILTKDIDMSNVQFIPIGISKSDISYFDERNPNNIGFYGIFDGNSFTISNLNYVGESIEPNDLGEYFGFFSVLGKGAHVKNLNIENANIGYKGEFTNVSAGILAGNLLNATVENCNVSGTVKGINNVGGLVGSSSLDYKVEDINIFCKIYNCKADVEVYGENWIGGFIGSNGGTIITNCSVNGIVTCDKITEDTNMPMGIGGFAGYNDCSEIRNCGASVWVKTMVNAGCVGSHVGLNEGDIYECFFNSTVSNWKPSGDSPRDELQNDVVGLPSDEYYKRVSEN